MSTQNSNEQRIKYRTTEERLICCFRCPINRCNIHIMLYDHAFRNLNPTINPPWDAAVNVLTEANSSTATPSSSNNDSHSNSQFLSLGGILFCVTITVLFFSLIMIARRCQANHMISSIQPEQETATAKRLRTYSEIEEWIVCRRALDNRKLCEQVCSRIPKIGDVEQPHEEEQECPICMEPFLKGQLISWSTASACDHCFHHQCIKQWLLKRRGCPFCRTCFLEIDYDENEADLEEAKNRRDDRLSCFCAHHGHVEITEQEYESNYDEWKTMLADLPLAEELVAWREESESFEQIDKSCSALEAREGDSNSLVDERDV